MKQFTGLLTLLIALTALSFSQGQRSVLPFEGIIEFKVQNLESVQFFESFVKGERMRMQTKEKLDYFPIQIHDNAARTVSLMVTATERYLSVPMPQSDPENAAPSFEVKETGEKETIAGLPCELFTVNLPDTQLDVWVTFALGTVAGFSNTVNQGNSDASDWESYFTSKGYTAVRVIVYNTEGHEQGQFEVTSVTRKAVPESLFRVPRGYEQVARQEDLVPRRR